MKTILLTIMFVFGTAYAELAEEIDYTAYTDEDVRVDICKLDRTNKDDLVHNLKNYHRLIDEAKKRSIKIWEDMEFKVSKDQILDITDFLNRLWISAKDLQMRLDAIVALRECGLLDKCEFEFYLREVDEQVKTELRHVKEQKKQLKKEDKDERKVKEAELKKTSEDLQEIKRQLQCAKKALAAIED